MGRIQKTEIERENEIEELRLDFIEVWERMEVLNARLDAHGKLINSLNNEVNELKLSKKPEHAVIMGGEF